MPNFELFTKRGSTTATEPVVTFQKGGAIALTKPAVELMGNPTHAELLFDREARIVGIRGVPPETGHAYPLRHTDANPNQWIMSGLAFMKFYGLKFDVSRRFPAQMEDGVLCVDLNVDGTEVVGNRNGQSGGAAEEGEASAAT